MSMLVIVNSASAGGRTAGRWPRIEAALRDAGVQFDHVFTEARGHAIELTLEALSAGRTTIAACGGDGTLNEVVNGLLDETGTQRAPGTRLGIVPSGTGGDFRKMFDIGTDPREAAAVLARGGSRPADAGLIEFADGSPSRRFLNVASCGVGHEVDRRMDGLFFKPGRVAYTLVIAWSILLYRSPNMRLKIDGMPVRGNFLSVAVANAKCFGGGMMIAPEAEIDDGLFDVVLNSSTRHSALARARRLYAGRHLDAPGSVMLRGRRIELEPIDDDRVGFDIDGEALGFAPATISVLPGALEVCA